MAAPQDEVVVRDTRLDPHGEEAHRAVSNHEASEGNDGYLGISRKPENRFRAISSFRAMSS